MAKKHKYNTVTGKNARRTSVPGFILWLKFIFLLSLYIVSATACTKKNSGEEELSKTGFAFNTTYTITINAGGNSSLLDECVSKCAGYEKIFSRTLKGSELYNINEIEKIYKSIPNASKKTAVQIQEEIKEKASPGNDTVFTIGSDKSINFTVSKLMADILEKGLYYSELSGGKFDITIEPESSLWDFTSDSPEVPGRSEIKAAQGLVGYRNAKINGNQLILKVPGMGIELGAIAKGFIADQLKEYLVENGVTSGTVNLGGNILCIGRKTDGQPFRIGIQQPFADRNEIVTAVKAEDISVVSSGIYERYFMQDDKIYHHILNPLTGYPYDNGLSAVTIVSGSSVDGDALSTTCFALGIDKGMELANSLDDVYAVFITEDGKLYYSDGFKDIEIRE